MAYRLIRLDSKYLGHGIQIRWNTIFAAAFLTLGLGSFFLFLGNAIGLSAFHIGDPTASGALRFWSWIYVAATMVFSYFVGSLVCTRTNEIVSMAAGVLHGLVSWGLASVIGVFILGSFSPAVRSILAGVGTNSFNWLAACILGLGFIASAIGGMMGKESAQYSRLEGTKGLEVPKEGGIRGAA